MRKLALYLLIFILALFASAKTFASDTIIFWYPGEAGSTEEAQPILNEFVSYLGKKDDTLKLTAKYFNTTESGLDFIQKNKPSIGIVSFAAWEEHKKDFPEAEPILITKPLPDGNTTQEYFLVGANDKPINNIIVYSTEPLTKNLIQEKLKLADHYTIIAKQTDQILQKLKAIGSGELDALAILTPIEGATLLKIKSDWSKKIKVLKKSEPVPTAGVILFTPDANLKTKLQDELIKLDADPEAKDLLAELRLMGFAMPY